VAKKKVSKKKTTKKATTGIVDATIRTASIADVVAPEKRSVNFFVRLKKTNSDWAKSQAKAKGMNHSEYMDLLIDRLRGGDAHAETTR
jgi:hypothetical protein